jgi:hypothetical protein
LRNALQHDFAQRFARCRSGVHFVEFPPSTQYSCEVWTATGTTGDRTVAKQLIWPFSLGNRTHASFVLLLNA